ncbi:MAG: tyrosine-type recombinase/integrase [Actinophytocola sp.]|nr:tyrosine-type recombinase/integrase [Actinophytocola sp.]
MQPLGAVIHPPHPRSRVRGAVCRGALGLDHAQPGRHREAASAEAATTAATVPTQMAKIIEAAWHDDAEWGLYLWLAAVTGARRGEQVAIQFNSLDLDNKRIELRANYVWSPDGLIFKDTKNHQMRFVALDDATVELLSTHRRDCAEQLLMLSLPMTGKEFIFSNEPDRSKPRDPSSISRRYCRLMRRLGIDSELRQLRHYSATELLTAGVDLRTVAGRLGHGDGTTTLRHYAAWVRSADEHAAKSIGSRMPKLRGHRVAE